jgi:hypothetical protein
VACSGTQFATAVTNQEKPMNLRISVKSIAVAMPFAILAALPIAAHASPQCTTAPRSAWLSEAQMKEKVRQMGYRDIKVFKTTKSGCYEIYGRNAKGAKAEVYFNPVDGSVVQANED